MQVGRAPFSSVRRPEETREPVQQEAVQREPVQQEAVLVAPAQRLMGQRLRLRATPS